MELIDKAAIVAEIEKKMANIKEYCLREGHDVKFDVVPEQLSHILSFINTLEVTDVEQEKKKVIKKACKWLQKHSGDYLLYPFCEFDKGALLEDFKKEVV